jgi:hypothetical protein
VQICVAGRFRTQYEHATFLREVCASDDCLRRIDSARQIAFNAMLATVQREVYEGQVSAGFFYGALSLSCVYCSLGLLVIVTVFVMRADTTLGALWIGVGVAVWSGLAIGFWVVIGSSHAAYEGAERVSPDKFLQQTLEGALDLISAMAVAAVLAVLFRNYLVACLSLKRVVSARLERTIMMGILVVWACVCLYCFIGWVVLYVSQSDPMHVIRWTDQVLSSPSVELRIYPVIVSLCLLLGFANTICGIVTTALLPGKGVLRRDVLGSLVLTLAGGVVLAGLIIRTVAAFTAYDNAHATGILPPESFRYGVNRMAAEGLICVGLLFIAFFSLYALWRRQRAPVSEAAVAENYVPLLDSVPQAYANV